MEAGAYPQIYIFCFFLFLMKKKSLIISITIGVAVFLIFLNWVGLGAIASVFKRVNLGYLAIYFIISSATFLPQVFRWQVILRGHNKDVGFLMLLRQTIAGYAVSYITPAVRLGGEPLRAYMLKKEADVDLRTGSSSIIIDKFVELIGSLVFGAIGLVLLIFIPGVSFWFKLVLASLILYGFYGLFVLYYRTVTDRGSFSELFIRFRFIKIERIKGFVNTLQDVEKRLKEFFTKHKKELFISCFFYFMYGVMAVFEFKFLLLGLGVDASLSVVILSLTILGLMYFIPVPAALGFLEAGQTSLFYILEKEGGIGFVLSLVTRVRNLIFVALGFSLISYFSGGEIEKRIKKKK